MNFLDGFIEGSYITSCTSSCMHASDLYGGEFDVRGASYLNPKQDHQENILASVTQGQSLGDAIPWMEIL